MTEQPTPDQEQQLLLILKKIFADLDPLIQRLSTIEAFPKPVAGSPLAKDDLKSSPYQLSHFAAMALMSAVDHLSALRHLTETCADCSPGSMNFMITGHWALLRAALENASRAAWLLGPEDPSDRVERALRVQAANVRNQDAVAQMMPTGPAKPKADQLAKVEQIGVRAGLAPGLATKKFQYLEIVRYAGGFVHNDEELGEFYWRVCSGNAHGDTWAVLALQDRNTLDSGNGVATVGLTVSIKNLTLITHEVAETVEAAFGLFDYRSQPAE